MKKDIHPEYFEDATINCACGASYKTGSTKQTIQVELCATCHPFYTGTQTIIDTARRVERFQERAAKKDAAAKNRTGKAAKKARRAAKKQTSGPVVEVEETKTGRVIKKSIRVTKPKTETAVKQQKEQAEEKKTTEA